MRNNLRAFLVHTCNIERADVDVVTTTIRDRRVTKYDTVFTSVPCWFEPVGTTYDFHDQLGQIAIKQFNVHFLGGQSVLEGDRLKKGTEYYLVKGVQDNSDQGFHVVAQAEKKNYAMSSS